jgi:hypothetical protein
VRKRDISFGPRSEAGKETWDTFMTLAETTRKLNVSFYAYLRDRILTAHSIPPYSRVDRPSRAISAPGGFLGRALIPPAFLR